MNKKYVSIVAASMAALTLLAGCGSSTTTKDTADKEQKTIVVGTEPTFPPFEFTENDKDVGFDIDLTQAVCDKLGYKMEVKNLGFDALIPALKSGDVVGKTVGAQVGSKAADFAREHGANVKEFDTNSQGWLELEAGTCDAISIDSAVAMYYLKQGGDAKLKLVGEPITSRGVAMAISKDKTELRDKVNNALKELKADGTYATLYKKWFGVEPKNLD